MGRARGLRPWPHRPAPSRTALETIARIRQILEHGCTSEQVAQAQAELQAARQPRQPSLPLRVKP